MPQKKKKPQYPDGDSIRLDPEKRLCEEFDWVPISMKNDWKTIYGDGVTKK